ncbi:hypothetical protein [Polaribacter cellanae]|uniref:Uncharacterized protein n=1 Tax=Polaribacter cellanae TaxID=2818493 RepID=A0A975H560_9FLAO|nr:hypothetical protein [Polaribacter cellanae]QTE21076.1 hypothetical protein J3359_09460 [Polaribacter cellanae]
MSSKNESFSLKEASVLLKNTEEFYPIFYQESEEDLKIFKQKSYNAENAFWEKLRVDTQHFISKDFKISASRVYQFFKANKTPSNKYVRNFDIEEIECLRELVLTYETCIYDIKTKQPVLKNKNPSNKKPKKRFSTKQILYGFVICFAIIIPIILIQYDFINTEKKEVLEPLIQKKVLDTTKIKKDSLPKNINNMNIHIQVKDSGKIEQINNFGNVKEVNL